MPKELTQQQIKQLEENANLMKENGFSDEDIQDMSLQYIEEHGVVKKKENTTSSTQKSSTSSSGVSSSNSQSQNRTATQFKPLTEQQKVAGKSILGEGTKVVETQKKQQTQVKPTYPTTQELIKKSGGTGSDNLKTIQDNTVQIADIIDKFGQPDLRTDTQKQEEEDRIAKEKFKNKADLELIQDVSNFGSTDLKQNILDYYDINLKDNDAFNRLTETDKQLYNSIKQYNDIYSKINTLTEQYNNKNIGEDAYQQELKKLNTDRIKYELQTTNFINNRNKDIDNEIKQLKQNIYAGKMPNPKYNPIEPQYSMANNAKEITLTDADKKNLQNQIKILEKQKGLFTDNTKQQEVIDSYNSEIADLTKKKIIPDGADAKEALKILYTRKYKQLQMLIQQSENEGKASISSQGGLWGKAKEFIADAMAQDFTNNQKSRAGYENTLRQYMIDDKTATKIYELQDELNTLAPIVLLNRYGNYKNESEWKKFTNSFATKMLPTQQGKITTATEIAQNTDKILNELGLQQQEDVTGNDIQKGKYSTGEMLGNTVAFMVQFGLAPDPISKALRGFKLLSKIPKLKGLVTKIDDVVKYSQKSKLGRFLGDATMSGINYETKGQIFSGKQALGDEATFESGFAGVLGEKTFSSLYKILGGNIKVLETLIRMGGKGVGELGEETAQTIIQTAQEAGSFDEMVEDLKMQFPTMKDVGFFAISTFMMGMAFGANPELSRTWNNWRDKKLDALKKEGKYTEEDEKIVNEAISELQSEHKESVKEDLKNGIKVTEEEAQSIIENGTENEDGNIEIKDENGEDIVILDKENLTIVAKDFDKIFELDSSGTSASTKDKVLIANKLNNGEKLSGEEQDYYDTYKEEIEQLRTSKNENKITSTEPTNTGQEQINSTGVSTEKSNNTELGETSEQGLPTEQKEVQQNTAEIQKEIDDTKQIITELENNPNSPFHKLVNLEDKRKELVELENKQAELKALEQQDAKVSNQSKIEDKKADIERRVQEDPSLERGVLINFESGKTKEQLLEIVDKLKNGSITYDEVVKEFFNLPLNTLIEVKESFNNGTLADKIQFGIDVKEISDSTTQKKNKNEIIKIKEKALYDKQKAEDALRNSEFKIVKKKDPITGQITETKVKRNAEEKVKYENFYKQQINEANETIKNADAELKALKQQDAKVSNQSKIEDKKADIEIGKIANTEYEVKADGVYHQNKKLDNPGNKKTHKQLIEADIKRRRQEELTTLNVGDSYDVISSTGSYDGTWKVTEITDKFYRLIDDKGGKLNMSKTRVEENLKILDGVNETKYRKSNREEINAKYDAELKVLEQKPETTPNTEDWSKDVESTAKALEDSDFKTNTPIKGLSVRISDLRIAEDNLSKGKKSVTPDAPVDVTINLTTGERELSDGYHRYLEARGGSIESAKTTNLEGTIPAKIKFEINEKSSGFVKTREATNKEISEAYHKAKADGSNPELVKAVEDLLGKAPTQYTEAATQKKESGGVSSSALKDVEGKKADIERRRQENPSVERGVLINYESGKTKEQLIDIVNKLKNGEINLNEIIKEFFNLPINTLSEVKEAFKEGTLADKIQFGLDTNELSDLQPKTRSRESIINAKQKALFQKQKTEEALKDSEYKTVKKTDPITGKVTETKVKRTAEEKTKYDDFHKKALEDVNKEIEKYDAELKELENKTGDTLTNEVTEKEKNSNAVTTPKEKEQNSQSNFTADLSDADIPTEEKVLSINANMKKYGITNDSIKSLLKNAIEKVAGLSVNNIFDIASRIAKFDKYPIRLEHIVEAIQYEVGRVEKEQDLFTISLDDIQDTILSKYKQDTPSNKARINDIGISEKTYGSRSKKLTEIKKSFELLSNEAKALASQFIKRYYDAIKDDAKFTAEEYLDLLKGIVKNKDIVGVAENIQNAIKVIEDKEAIELQKLPPVKNPLKNKENTEDALRRFTSKELNQIPLHSKQSVEKMIDDSLKKNKEARINIPLGSLYGLPDKVMSVILNKDNNVIFLDKNGKEIKAIKFDREKFNDFAFNVAKEQNKSAYSLSEAYHKAKADGTNPELVKAVEDLLGAPNIQQGQISQTNTTTEFLPKETTPNVEDWSKDVESTAKALWGVQKENADKFVNDFANIDIPFRQKNIQAEMDSEVKKQLFPNEKSRRKYAETIYSAVVRSGNFPKILSEAYHKAKADGSNPELVKAVEEALTPQTENTKTNEEQSANADKVKTPENVAEITPNKKVSASKATAIKDLTTKTEKYSDLTEMEAGVLANLDGTELVDDLLEYVDWNRTTQKGGVYKGKGLKGSVILKLIEKGYIEDVSVSNETLPLTDKAKEFQKALEARVETRKAVKSGTDLFPNDANLQSTDKNFTPISKSKFNELLDKLKKAFPKVKVNFFNKDSEVEKILGTTWENVKAQVSNVEKRKNKQLQIINKTNPAPNNYNTWIRSTGDILTAEEAFKTAFEDGNMYPDFTVEDMKNALNRGKITVYSSYPIRKGVFVSPSKMMAEDYAGGKGGKVYSKEIDIKDLAWIDEAEGQYAPVKFLRTPQGTIYGFVKDGQIYLNADEVNANTPIHEFGHIWEQLFPKEFAKGIELLMASEQGRAYIKKIRQNPAYAGRTLDEVKAEALVTAIGDKGETIFNNNPTLLKKFQDWLKDFFKTIGDKLGIINLSADERFEDFTKKVVGDLLGGKELKGESKAENIIAFQQDYAIESDFKKDSKGNIKKDEQGNPILTEKAKKEIAEEYAEIEKRYNGKAPNGKPSKLTKEQWILTRTSRFKDWFGDWENDPKNASKVVDENGEPLVVYHGTSAEFNEFSNKDAGKYTSDNGKLGFFFTDSLDLANDFTKKKWSNSNSKPRKGAKIVIGFNNIKNPKIITARQFTMIGKVDVYKNDLINEGFDGLIIEPFNEGDRESWIRLFGTNGIKEFEHYQFANFTPNQIKSATDNVGTFDAGNNDIRFQIEEESNTPQQNETVKNLRNSFIKLMNLGKDLDFVFAIMDKNNLIYDKDKITNLWNKTKAEIEQEYKNNLNDEQKTEDSITETETKESGGNRKKRTFYYGRAYLGDLPKEVKDKMSKYDFDYTIQNQAKAEKEALEIINDIGLETAFELARTGKIRGGHKAIIYSKALEDINEKMLKTNDQIEKENLQDAMVDILNEFSDQLKEGGQFSSMMARIYKNSNLSYNADWRIKKYKDANNGEIPKEVEERFKELEEIIKAKDKEIAELEQKQKEAVTNDAITQIKEKAKSRKKEKLSVKTRIFADKFRRKLKTKPPVFTDEDGNEFEITQNAILSWNEIVEFGAIAIETSASLLEAVEKTISKLEEQEWYQKLSEKNKKKAKDALLEAFDEDNIIDENFKIPKDVLYDLVEKGVSKNQDYNIDNLVDDVYDLLGDSSLDKRDLRDKITNYGEQLKDTRDDIEKKITELKRTGKLLSAYEDLQNGIMPKRSGLTRDEMTLEQRDLRKQINELLKQMPQSEEEQSKIWKSALDAMEKRLTNRIEELQGEIDKGERLIKEKNKIELTDKILSLKQKVNELQKERDEKLGKTELSPEAKIKMLENSLTKNIKNLEDTIRFINQHNSLPETKPKEKISSERIEELKAERQKQKETLNELLKQKGISEKKRIELAKKRVQKSIEDLKKRLDNKDFSKAKRKPLPFEEELNKARIDRLKAKEEFDVAMYKAELDNRTKKQKALDLFLDILNLPKALKATIDLSAPLRQGATLLATHPTIWKDAFVDMHKMAKNENVYNERLSNIKNADDFLLMMESGLSITDTDARLKAKEELFMTDLPKKIPVFKFFHGASERAYSGFLNDLRVGVFRDGVKQLQNAGITYENDPEAYKSLAKMVNNATGRGRSVTKDDSWNKILNTLFFSPKMITSRIGMIADMFSNNDVVRKMAIRNMAGFVAYYGTLTALSSLAVSRYSDDDDDKDALKNSFNPLHTDFMKMRKGHTTYDLTAGFSQIFRTMARVMSGKRINSQNKEYNLDGSGYQRENRLSEIGRFLSNKFSPSARVIISTLLNKHPTDYYGKLEDATIKDYLEALLIPMSLEHAYELYTNDEIKASEAFLMTLLATYGVGVQQESSSNNKNSSKLRTETNKK